MVYFMESLGRIFVSMFGLVTVKRVAEELECTPVRVRQMVAEGKFPKPFLLGERSSVWQLSEVKAWLRRRGGALATPLASTLKPPAAPLKRVIDRVARVDLPYLYLLGNTVVHVRIWRGAAPEGQRIVVVLGTPEDSTMGLSGHQEALATWIEDTFLPDEAGAAVWFNAYSGLLDDGPLLQNVVLSLTPAGGFEAESWSYSDPAVLNDVVGEEVEWFPKGAYRTEIVEQWQRRAQVDPTAQIDVPYDRSGLGRTGDALIALDSVASGHDQSIARQALPYVGRWVSAAASMNRNVHQFEPWAEEWANVKTVARFVPYELPPAAEEIARKYSEIPKRTASEVFGLMTDLETWSERVYPTGDTPHERLHLAIGEALVSVRRELKLLGAEGDVLLAAHVYPRERFRVFDIGPDVDVRYLDHIAWLPRRPDGRQFRELEKKFSPSDRVKFAFDRFGHAVARTDRVFAVAWPTQVDIDPHAEELFLVADGAGGSRPVFFENVHGVIVGLLPYTTRLAANEWNFGYSGGGPGQLETDISTHFARQLGLTREELPARWIEDQVEHSSRKTLRIPIEDLLRRLSALPG